MDKTKEEIIIKAAKKAFMDYFIHRGKEEDIDWNSETASRFVNRVKAPLLKAMEEYGQQQYSKGHSAGFEAFREKVEREVKKLQGNDQSFEKINSTIKTVLTTIKDIRE